VAFLFTSTFKALLLWSIYPILYPPIIISVFWCVIHYSVGYMWVSPAPLPLERVPFYSYSVLLCEDTFCYISFFSFYTMLGHCGLYYGILDIVLVQTHPHLVVISFVCRWTDQ